jgi:hypothetical protein
VCKQLTVLKGEAYDIIWAFLRHFYINVSTEEHILKILFQFHMGNKRLSTVMLNEDVLFYKLLPESCEV